MKANQISPVIITFKGFEGRFVVVRDSKSHQGTCYDCALCHEIDENLCSKASENRFTNCIREGFHYETV